MNNFTEKLKTFLHDPIDKCFDIQGHVERTKKYAETLGVSNVDHIQGPDWIASCMERSLLPVNLIQEFDQIRHPLCEGFLKLSDKIDVKNVFADVKNIIENTFNQISKNISAWDDKKKFIYLWRNLQEKIFEGARDKNWIKFLPLFPADTRVPDHSIWEHLKIASAIMAFWDEENKILFQNNALLLFTMGPVQSFISQARKTQDFYMGSFILSFLTFKAMEIIIDKYGPTNIIYPDLYRQPLADFWIEKSLQFTPSGFNENLLTLPTIPNRFVAILPTSEKSEIESIITEMKNQVKKSINEAKTLILSKFELNIQEEVNKKMISQLSDFPEIYWVVVPWKKVDNNDVSLTDLKDFFEKDYIQVYENFWKFAQEKGEFKPNIGLLYEIIYSFLEKSLGARKNARQFKQSDVEEKGRKCSVCGERDTIFFKERQNKSKFTKFSQYVVDLTDNNKVSSKFITDGEGLCALCFFKRTFEIFLEKKVSNKFKELTFPSTAEIACLDFKEKMLADAKSEYKEYLIKLKDLLGDFEDLDNTLFYEENLSEKYIKDEYGFSISLNKLNELKNSLKKITDKIGEPNSYYAIIYLDGDNMGKWLAGELLPGIEHAYTSELWESLPDNFKDNLKRIKRQKFLTPSIHASISVALRNYSLEFVKKIVEEEHLGKLVYAGGDDVLAFVNLSNLFEVMHKLRWAFSGHIKIENGETKVDLNSQTGFVEKEGRYLLTMGSNATASMGIVITHYKTPLQIVIKKVFGMEKIAKSTGRNGFAICLMRRSGEERVATAKWKYDERDTIEILKDITKSFDEKNQKGYIAKSFIQKIVNDFINLKEDGRFTATGEVFNVELSRLLERSFNAPKGRKIEKGEKEQFLNYVYEKMKNLFWDTGGNLDNFVNFCIISTFILKVED